MPIERQTDGPATKIKPFKPPRPSAKSSAKPSASTQSSNNSNSSNRSEPSVPTPNALPSVNETSRPEAAPSDESGLEGRQVSIPPALLTRLLHEFFSDDQVRISKGADRAIAKYMDTFVREAIARAAVERMEGLGVAGGVARGEGFLEVEDLEKVAPQLVLDF